MYVFAGTGATATLLITTAAKESGFGSLLTIGLAYALGIACKSLSCPSILGIRRNETLNIPYPL